MATSGNSLLGERYQLLDEIGHDEITVLYRAFDTEEQRTVAVRMVRDTYGNDSTMVERFLEAARQGEKLRGPHIVDVYVSGEDNGRYFAVIEWVEGQSLRELVDERPGGHLPPAEAARVALQITHALEAAHGQGIVHGNMSPDRVLVNSTGRAQVTGFGFTRLLAPPPDPEGLPSTIPGSSGPYLAPEQIRGAPPDIRADLFAVGAMLLEMVAGASARDALAAWRLGRSQSMTPPPQPRTFVPNIPSMLESIILRALRYLPAERYSSASELAHDLESFLDGLASQTVVRPVVPVETIPDDLIGPEDETIYLERPVSQPAVSGLPIGWLPLSALGMIFAFVGCALLGMALGVFNPASERVGTVPSLAGMSYDEATRVATSAGFSLAISEQRQVSGQLPGTVLSQSTEAGARLARGQTILVVIVAFPATSAPLREVPNVIGQSQAGAFQLIESSGFKVGAVTTRPDASTAGLVIDQNPRPLLQMALGSSVDLVVSTGPSATAVPTLVVPPPGCLNDERMSFNPPQPVHNQPLLIDVYSARPHTGVALTGPGNAVFINVAQEGTLYHWQWQSVPATPGHYEYIFTVNDGLICARGSFDIGGLSTVPPGATTVPPPATPGGPVTLVLMWGAPGTGNGQFRAPAGAAGQGGFVYVADADNNRVQKFDANGNFLAAFGTSGTDPGRFNRPLGLVVRPDGGLIVADSNNNRLQLLDALGNPLAQWGSEGGEPGRFRRPSGVALDASGNIYVADTNNNRVQKLDANGNFLLQFGLLGPGPGQLNHPAALTVDGEGFVYVADANNHRVQKFRGDGGYVMTWGGFGTANGQFNAPAGIALDAQGFVYVVDGGNHRVQKFSREGLWQTTWGGGGSAPGQFSGPIGIATTVDGSIFVVDSGNGRVQKFR